MRAKDLRKNGQIGPRMDLGEAIGVVFAEAENALVVSANGMISRAAFSGHDRPENFYMIGSMGLASSIGLGAALALPSRRVIVCDGDGNVLMNLGTLAAIAAQSPTNLLHVCFDNGVYGSTGNQRTLSTAVRLDEMARAAGYAYSVRVSGRDDLRERLALARERPGPGFILVDITPDLPEPPFGRVAIDPPELARRFRAAALRE